MDRCIFRSITRSSSIGLGAFAYWPGSVFTRLSRVDLHYACLVAEGREVFLGGVPITSSQGCHQFQGYIFSKFYVPGGGGYGRKNALTQGDGYRKRLNIVHILELFLILFISTVTDNSLPFSVFLRRISEKAK